MNLLLLTEDDFDERGADDVEGAGGAPIGDGASPSQRRAGPCPPRLARVEDERLTHLRKVLRVAVGDELKAGVLDGALGRARVLAIDRNECRLEVELFEPPPPPLPATLVLALPRPKFLGRILQSVAAMGVKELVLIDAARVEKSFWSSSLLEPAALRRHLLLGLAQGRDSTLPRLDLERSWNGALARIGRLLAHSQGYVADGGASRPFEASIPSPATIVVGPEGGLLDHEIEQLEQQGAETRSLGPRPLRVETAVAVLLGRVPLPAE